MFDISLVDLSLVPIITGLVEVVKKVKIIKEKFLPLIALVLGILGAFALPVGNTVFLKIINGLVIGLASSGFYSWTKTALGK